MVGQLRPPLQQIVVVVADWQASVPGKEMQKYVEMRLVMQTQKKKPEVKPYFSG